MIGEKRVDDRDFLLRVLAGRERALRKDMPIGNVGGQAGRTREDEKYVGCLVEVVKGHLRWMTDVCMVCLGCI